MDSKRIIPMAILIGLSALVVGVYALTPGVAPNPGHTLDTVAPPAGCVAGRILKWDGASWTCVAESAGYYVPSDVKVTTATHNGNFGGYKQINDWIQTNGCAGYHVCEDTELVRYVESGGSPANVAGWYTQGGMNFGGDCKGWTFSSTGFTGGRWQANRPLEYGEGGSNSCNAAYKVWCCK